jgi:hypothetical protein
MMKANLSTWTWRIQPTIVFTIQSTMRQWRLTATTDTILILVCPRHNGVLYVYRAGGFNLRKEKTFTLW